MTDPYKQMLKDAGMPTDEAGIKAEWDKINQASEVQILNDSAWSPFWRLITAIVTRPAMWLINLLMAHALPNAFLKDARGQWLNMLAWAVDLERKAAAKALGHIVFTRENSEGEVLVEAGILVATPPINGKVYRVKTVEAVTFADGSTGGPVPVEAEYPGTAHNLGPGYYQVLPEPVDGITSVTNETDWLTTAGADEEADESLRLRCRNQFSAVGQYHHDAAYRADIASFAGIAPNYIWFEHGAPRGPGTANAYIMVDSGCPTQAFVDQINDYIQDMGHHGHGDDMLCMPMPASPRALAVTVNHSGALDTAGRDALQAAVSDRIRYAFRENQDFTGITRTMPFSRFSFSRLADELHGQVPEIESIAFSLQDIKSAMDLPTLSSLAVTPEVSLMLPEQPKPVLPSWMNKGEAEKLAGTAHEWFTRLGEWAQLPLQQLDPLTCTESILDLLAWQRDIERFASEPLELYRLRVRHAYANAVDAGSVEGFKRIFQRLGVGDIDLEERMAGMDWDIINIILSDAQLGGNEPLLDCIIRQYGRTCRRYGWKVEIEFPVAMVVAEVSNDTMTETATMQVLTDTIQIQVAEFSNDQVTEQVSVQELTDNNYIRIVEFSNDQITIPMEVE